MSRPKPTIILDHTDTKTHKIEQVLEADAIYAVFHNDEPINLKLLSKQDGDLNYKYKKTSFSNSGHAFNLAERLNKLFNTESFSVYMLCDGKKINESEQK